MPFFKFLCFSLMTIALKVLPLNLAGTIQKIKVILQQFFNSYSIYVILLQEIAEGGIHLYNYNLYTTRIYKANKYENRGT